MNFYRVIRPIVFSLPPEFAHNLTHAILRTIQNTPIADLIESRYRFRDSRLEQTLWGCTFPNPIGLAAGFDKNARIPGIMSCFGFGHIEVGGVTAEAQQGNPKPRMFRLSMDRAIINRMGFNNHGADRVASYLENQVLPDIPLGINIGKSKNTPLPEAANDYGYTYERVSEFGDYFVINVSSPNTPNLRDLQGKSYLTELLSDLKNRGASPLLVKISPDLRREEIEAVLKVAHEVGLQGVVATNTTTERSHTLKSENQTEDGGLSGQPLQSKSTEVIRFIAQRTDLPIIGVGGIFSAEDAYRKIQAGASILQLYTGLIFEGPSIARNINKGILERLERDGFDSLEEAVGSKSE